MARAAQSPAPKRSPRNLVVCCDGTSNEIGANLSNVLKLYRMIVKDDGQRAFYDPGVGTIGKLATWGRAWQNFKTILGLATGYGLDDNILDAYRWLCLNYEEGDRIFLFGFSRGAYTVRALGGLINMIGLLDPDQLNITDYALTAYKRAAERDDLPIAWEFQRVSAARDVAIHFVGVWDTVASIIVPRPDRLYLPSLQSLPYTKQNHRVATFRQAIAIDERRRMFRSYPWLEGQSYSARRFGPKDATPQDCRQVWFAGVHADIGAGYPEEESGISKFPLKWMVGEARQHGLRLNERLYQHLVEGRPVPHGRQHYVRADPRGPIHRSLRGLWWILEYLPKSARWREWPKRRVFLGLYLPRGEPRAVPEHARIHESVFKRIETVPDYKPVNLPSDYIVEMESMTDAIEAVAPSFQELAEQIYNAAERVIESHGLRFGEGADKFLHERAESGAREILERNNGDATSPAAIRLATEAQANFARFAEAMVRARQQIPDQDYFARNVAGERTVEQARAWLCPLFPIC